MRTEKSQKLQFYNMDIAGLLSNDCHSKSRTFENLVESGSVTDWILKLPFIHTY